ncbi:VPS10 domain-containing receptor 3 [Sigmodon hispidus]
MNRWPEELASARRATALRHRSRLELLPRANGGETRAEAEGMSPEDVRWVRGIPAPSTAGSSRRTRRAQPPSTLELGDAWATAPADGAKGNRPQTKGSREEVKATRTGGPATEELRLPSTSFALTGDSAHNQAMVHWSGHNSSITSLFLFLCHLSPQDIVAPSISLPPGFGAQEWGVQQNRVLSRELQPLEGSISTSLPLSKNCLPKFFALSFLLWSLFHLALPNRFSGVAFRFI